MGVEPPSRMGTLFLKDGRVLELSDEQTMYLAKLIFFIPNHKQIKLNGEIFTLDDLDHEAKRLSQLPQQTGIGINVAAVDKSERRTNQ